AKGDIFFGTGPESWKINFLKAGPKGINSEDNLTFYQRPHNDYLGILSEKGVFSLITFLLFLGTGLYYAVAVVRRSTDLHSKFLGYVAFFGITGYSVFSFFSYPEERVTQSFLLFLLLGFLIMAYHRQKEKGESNDGTAIKWA